MEDLWLKRWNTLKNHINHKMEASDCFDDDYHSLTELVSVMEQIEEMTDDVPGVGSEAKD